MQFLARMQSLLDATKAVDFLGPLALRALPGPGLLGRRYQQTQRHGQRDCVVRQPRLGLGLPAPALMAWLATGTEVVGAIALLIGLATRWFAIPLMVTMLVAASKFTGKMAGRPSRIRKAVGKRQRRRGRRALGYGKTAVERKRQLRLVDRNRQLVVSNNGIEWAITYFVMLLALFFSGAGKLSVDHLIGNRLKAQSA